MLRECVLVAALLAVVAAPGQDSTPDDVIGALLEMRAPEPGWRPAPISDPLSTITEESSSEPPPDNASLEELVEYRRRAAGRRSKDRPSQGARERLLAACEAEPSLVPQLLDFIPKHRGSHIRVKALLDREEIEGEYGNGWLEVVHEWLMFNSDLTSE